jgi:short-subunit dehydrogenase
VHAHYGRIDGLVNNAGRGYAASVEEIDPALFDQIFRLNVLGPIVAMQAVIPPMRTQGGGCIVNINSGTAFMTIPQYSVYSSSKRALLGFSLTARAELEKDNIVVSEVYPFLTATNFGRNRIGNPSGGGPASNYAGVIPPNSWQVSFCKRLKRVRLSISPMIGFERWPVSWARDGATAVSPILSAGGTSSKKERQPPCPTAEGVGHGKPL